jgi:predicted deacylase
MSRSGVAHLTPGPGQAVRGMVRVPGVDPPWEFPAFVIRGAAPGPTLAVTAGIHAAEYPPIEAATRVARELDPARLHGSVIVVPLVNVPGFFARSIYVNPVDGRNLNRAFPGSATGVASERVANFLLEHVIDGCDAYLDLHCGDMIEALVPFVGYHVTGRDDVDGRSRALSEAFGVEHVIASRSADLPGTAYANAALRGVPALLAEIGQQGVYERRSVERLVRGVRAVMARLGMLPGAAPPAPGPRRELARFSWLHAEDSGTYHPSISVGDEVAEGQEVGEVRDLFGDRLRVLRAPASGTVLFLVTSLAINRGEPLFGVGVPA